MTEDFYAAIAKEESKIKDIAQRAVEYAKSLGVDEAEATIGLQKGLSVSTRKADVENIRFQAHERIKPHMPKPGCTLLLSPSD